MKVIKKLTHHKRIKSLSRPIRCIRYRYMRRRHKRHLKKCNLPYSHCQNCGHELKGMYCHACGQYARDINPNIFSFVWQYLENAFQLDGKGWITMRRLFINPGRLSSEFMQGHIRRYVFPLKLYMCVAVIFGFAILAAQDQAKKTSDLTDEKNLTIQDSIIMATISDKQELDSAKVKRLEQLLTPKMKKQSKTSQNIIASSINFAGRLPVIMMFAMPVFALFSRLFYRRKYKKYLPHLIFSIHLHTVFFTTIIGLIILNLLWDSPFVYNIMWVLLGWMIFYGYIAAKRFYQDSWAKVFWKNIGLYSMYYIFCFIVFLLGFLINLCYDSWAAGDGFLTPIKEGIGAL